MAVLFPIPNQQKFQNVQYQNLFPQGMNTLQGGTSQIYQPPNPNWQPSLQTVSTAMYPPPTLQIAQNSTPVQLNPYNITTPDYDRQQREILSTYDNSDPRLQNILGNSNYSTLYDGSVQTQNPFLRLSAQTTTPPEQSDTATATTPATAQSPAPTPAPEQTPATAPAPEQNSQAVAAQNAQKLVETFSDVSQPKQPEQQKMKLFETPEKMENTVKNYSNILGTIPAGYYGKINAQPLLNGDDLKLGQQIVETKAGYHAINEMVKGIDAALSDKDVSDDDKKLLTAAKADYQNQLLNLNQYAEFLRNASGSNVNWADYGLSSQDNLAQSQAALYNQQERGMRHFLNLPSGKELEKQRQQEYKDAGVGGSWARYLARKDREEIDRDLSGQYLDAMQTYGINADGSLNNYGFALASKWAKDDPTSANLYLQGYAAPNAQFNARVNLGNTLLGQEGADRRSALQAQVNLYGRNLSHDETIKALEQEAALKVASIDSANARAAMNAQIAAKRIELQQQELNLKSPLGQIQQNYETLTALGMNPQEASRIVTQNYLEKVGVLQKPSEQETATDSFFDGIFRQMADGDINGVIELYNNYKTFGDGEDPLKKFKGLSKGSVQKYSGYESAIEEYFANNDRTTSEQDKQRNLTKLFAKRRAIDAGEPDKWNDYYQAMIRNNTHNKDVKPNNTKLLDEKVREQLTDRSTNSSGISATSVNPNEYWRNF